MKLLIGPLGSVYVPSDSLAGRITVPLIVNSSTVGSHTLAAGQRAITLTVITNQSVVRTPLLGSDLPEPDNVTVEALPRAIRVSCDMITRTDHIGFEVHRSLNGGAFSKVADIREHVYEDLNVSPGSTYTYRLYAKYRTFQHNDWFDDDSLQLSNPSGDFAAVAVDPDLEYWVDPDDGSDSNAGTVLLPFATWQKALDEAHDNRNAGLSTYINTIPGKRYRPDPALLLYAAKSESANNSGELAGIIRLASTPSDSAHIVIDLGDAIIDGSIEFSETWTDRSVDLGGGSGNIWSAPWPYKFGYTSRNQDSQGAMSVARDDVYLNDVALRPCKAALNYSFTLPLMTAPAAGTQETIVVSTGDNAPYMGQSDGSGGNYLNLGTFEFYVTNGVEEEYILVRQHNTLGTLEVTRGRRNTTPFAWPNGTAASYSFDPGSSYDQAYCIANEGTFYIDEDAEEILIHPAGSLDPNNETIDVTVCPELIRFQSGTAEKVTIRGSGATIQRSIDQFNNGASATCFAAEASHFWIKGDITWRRSNYTSLNVVGSQAQEPESAIRWHVLNGNTFYDSGGQSYALYRCVNGIQTDNIDYDSNWRGALGDWYQWNTGNKIANESHKIYHCRNKHYRCKGDNWWFDLDGEDVVIEDNLFADGWRYSFFLEALRGSAGREVQVRRNRFVGNGSSTLPENAKGSIDINATSSHVLFEDNYLDGLDVCDRMIRLSGDDDRWHETHWDSESPIYLHEVPIVGYDVVLSDTIKLAGDLIGSFPNDLDYHGLVISGSTNNDGDFTISAVSLNEEGDTLVTFNESINDAVIDGVVSTQFNFIPHSWTFRRNIVRGYLDALWSYQNISTSTAGTFFETLDTDWNIFQLEASSSFPNPDSNEDARTSHDAFKTMLATKGAPGNRDANTRLMNLGTIVDPYAEDILQVIEDNLRPATPYIPADLAVSRFGTVSWTDIGEQILNPKAVEVSIASVSGDTNTVAVVNAGTSEFLLVEGTHYNYGSQYYAKVRATNLLDVSGAWSDEVAFIINEPIIKLAGAFAGQDDDTLAGTVSLPAGTETLVMVVSADADATNPITSAEYNELPLTQVTGALALQNFQGSASVFLLDSPTIGEDITFEVNSNVSGGEIFCWIYALKNCLSGDEIDIVGADQQGTGSTTQSLNVVSTVAEGLIIDIVIHSTAEALTAGANQVDALTATRGSKAAGTSCQFLDGPGTYSMEWTGATNSAWAHVAIVIKNISVSDALPPTNFRFDKLNTLNDSLRVAWTDPVTPGKALDYLELAGGLTPSPTTLVTPQIDGGAEDWDIVSGFSVDDIYYARIRAVYDDGSVSSWTSDVVIYVAQPSLLIATGIPGSIDWDGTGTGTPDSYKLYYGVSPGIYTFTLSDTEPDMSTPAGSSEAQWGRLVAIKSGVESAYSNEAVATASDTTAPSAGTLDLLDVLSAVSIEVNFTAPSDADVATYHVLRSTTTGGPYTEVGSGSIAADESDVFIDTGLAYATEYFYVVEFEDGAGNRSPSSTEDSATTEALTEPTFDSITASVVAGDTPTGMIFNVTEGTHSILSVQAKLGTELNPTDLTNVLTDSGSGYIGDSLIAFIQAEPINVYLEIDTGVDVYWKGPVLLNVDALAAPTLTAEPDGPNADSLITLEYAHGQSAGRSLSYQVQVQVSGGSWSLLLVDDTVASLSKSILAGTLSNDVIYEWRARAINDSVTGGWSSVDTFFTSTGITLSGSVVNSSTVHAMSLTETGAGVTLSSITNVSTVHAMSVVPAAMALTLTSITNSSTIHAMTVANVPAGITLSSISNTSTMHAMTVANVPAGITLGSISNSSTMHAMTLAAASGAGSITLSSIANTSTMHAMTVANVPAGITLSSISNTSTIHAMTVANVPAGITLGSISNSSTMHAMTVDVSANVLTLTSISNTSTIHAMTVANVPAGITLSSISNTSTMHAVTAAAASSGITGPNDTNWDGEANLNYALVSWLSTIYSDAGTTVQSTDDGAVGQIDNYATGSSDYQREDQGGNRPRLKTSVQNSKDAIDFDGTENMVDGNLTSTSADQTHIFCFDMHTVDSNDVLVTIGGNNARIYWDGTEWVYRRSSTGTIMGLGGTATGLKILLLELTATTVKYAWGLAAISSDQSSGNGPDTSYDAGTSHTHFANSNGSGETDGRLYVHICVDDTLTTEGQDDIRNWINDELDVGL